MKFADKVKFKKENAHPDLKEGEFCLLGFNESAFALVPWEKRGHYFFDYYTGIAEDELEVVSA